jgi:acetyl esterase/lipase
MKDRRLLNRREALQIAGFSILGQTAVNMGAPLGTSRQANSQRSGIAASTDRTHSATPTGVQDFVDQAPADIFAGPIVMNGQVVYHAIDDSWIELIPQSHWGNFIYVITRLGTEPGTLSRLPGTPAVPSGITSSREIPWKAIQAGSKPTLRLEGEITVARSEGAELEGRFAFKDEIVRLGFKLIENNLLGYDPAPTFRSLYYGSNVRQKLDVYLTKAPAPAPVAVYLHGGGWQRGDKSDLRGHHVLLDAGISVVAVDYRYLPQENPSASTPAVAVPLSDAARAIQFIRSKAAEWGLAKDRLGVWGISAGACSSLWLGTHPDMADLSSSDPVLRESTRPACVSAVAPQTSLDPEQMRAWVGPGLTYGPQAFGIKGFEEFLRERERLLPWIREYSPAALLSRTSAPIFLDYRNIPLIPFDPLGGYYTHSPQFGVGFLKLARQIGAECYLRYGGHEPERFRSWQQFLLEKLTPQRLERSQLAR